jgi:hypothetical protein
MSVLNELRAISNNLATAARFGSKTAMDLSIIANEQVSKINADDPMDSAEVLQGISALTKIANESASIGINLINSNKKEIAESNMIDEKNRLESNKFIDVSCISTSALKELQAAKNATHRR